MPSQHTSISKSSASEFIPSNVLALIPAIEAQGIEDGHRLALEVFHGIDSVLGGEGTTALNLWECTHAALEQLAMPGGVARNAGHARQSERRTKRAAKVGG